MVLAGGGARGAYEAGALSVLLPELERRGQRPTVLVGTSAGALNVVCLAADADLDAERASARLVERWLGVARDDVLRPIVRRQAPVTAMRYAGEVVGVPGMGLPGLLDPAPLRASLDRLIDWAAVHRNVRRGALDLRCGGRLGCRRPAQRGVCRGPSSARTAVGAGDRVRDREAFGRPRARIKRDPGAVSRRASGGARPRPRLVLRRRHAPEHADQTGAGPWSRSPDRGRHAFDRPPPTRVLGPVGLPSGLRRGALQLLQATLVDPMLEDVRMLGKTNLLVGRRGAPAAVTAYRKPQ